MKDREMPITSSLAPYRFRGLAQLLELYRRSRSNNVVIQQRFPLGFPFPVRRINNSYQQVLPLGFRFATSPSGMMKKSDKTFSMPPKPSPPNPWFPKWVRWALGALTLFVSFWWPKGPSLLTIEGKAEVLVEEAEQVAETVETVAGVVEKVSSDVAEILPDNTKFKEAALFVEHVSEEATKDALLAEQILHKVDVVKHDLEDMKTMAGPIIEKIVHEKSQGK